MKNMQIVVLDDQARETIPLIVGPLGCKTCNWLLRRRPAAKENIACMINSTTRYMRPVGESYEREDRPPVDIHNASPRREAKVYTHADSDGDKTGPSIWMAHD